MTPEEWLSHARSEMRAERRADWSINRAAGEAMAELLDGWNSSINDGIACSVLIHDLKEVAQRLVEIHDALEMKLPSALDELAAR